MKKQENKARYAKTNLIEAKDGIYELISDHQFLDMINFKQKCIPIRIPDSILFVKGSKKIRINNIKLDKSKYGNLILNRKKN